MRRSVALTLIGLVAATPLAAQFEGTVSLRMSTPNAGDINMKVSVKGERSATVLTMPSTGGPMAGMEMRAVYDGNANTMTMLMPMLAGMAGMPGMANAKGIKTVVDLTKGQAVAATGANSKADVRKLGTSETIIGMSCDDYEVTNAGNQPTKMCMTSALGRFVPPQMSGGMGRGGSQQPAWTQAFGNKPVFPLKVWTNDGKVDMEVTRVDKGSVPASVFEIPDGYIDMAAMMNGMRPPPR